MSIEEYKKQIFIMVEEITNFDFIIQIYTATHFLYQRFKGE